jgi:hypothetical protein
MAVSHVYSQTVADGTATSVVRPSDWNSAHNQYVTLAGNTAGQSTISGTNIAFQGGNNVTLSANTAAGGATIVISGANGGGAAVHGLYWPNDIIPVATSAFVSGTSTTVVGGTQHSVSMYVAPMYLESPLSYKEVEMVVSGQATTAGTGSNSMGYMIGLYSNNASTLSLITSYQWVHVMSQNSVTAQSHTWWWGTNSTTQSSGLNGNVSASFTRVAPIILEDGTGSSLPAGTYYVAVVHTARTSGLNVGGVSSAMCWSYSQSTGGSYFGTTVLKPPFAERFFGIASRTLSAANSALLSMPSTIQSSQITNTGGSSQWRIPFVRWYSNE